MIHVDRSALDSSAMKYLIQRSLPFDIIDDPASVPDEKSEIILLAKRDLYCHPCPATKIYRCCNYYTSDVMEGCPFDCSYCILQGYLPHKNIQISSDTDAIVTAIKTLIHDGERRRLGTGELSDSLALDNIFPFSQLIIPLINGQDTVQFEFKTKSTNITNLLGLNPKNIVVSWSLNPPEIADAEELGAAPVYKRLDAARQCAMAGYQVGFHFDPVIVYDEWQKGYSSLLEMLFEAVPEKSVEYISISTFRATGTLMDRMRERPVPSKLLQGDMILGPDGKLRYFKALRRELLNHLTSKLYRHWPGVFVYYCMEHESLWQALKGFDPGGREEFEKLFPYRQG